MANECYRMLYTAYLNRNRNYKSNSVKCALTVPLLHSLLCSCAQIICPACLMPPVTTRQCAGLCTQKPGSCTPSWRRLRVPKRWVPIFITITIIIMTVGLCSWYFWTHQKVDPVTLCGSMNPVNNMTDTVGGISVAELWITLIMQFELQKIAAVIKHTSVMIHTHNPCPIA